MNKDDEFNSKELPDGMTIDINGNLWVAIFRGSRIVNIDAKTGQYLLINDSMNCTTTIMMETKKTFPSFIVTKQAR